MWYLGTSTGSRSSDIALGYAESDDGIEWREYDGNPILTGDDLPWGSNFQTPFVLFDDDEHIYKMWFVSVTEIERDEAGQMTEMTQALGYATSSDGIRWRIHPEPIYESGRSPSVIKEGPGRYRMWMGSRPSRQHPPGDLYRNIYEFTSTDGVQWERSDQPVLQPTGRANSTVYPFVLKWGIHLTQVAPRRCGLVDPWTPAHCTQNAPWGARRRSAGNWATRLRFGPIKDYARAMAIAGLETWCYRQAFPGAANGQPQYVVVT